MTHCPYCPFCLEVLTDVIIGRHSYVTHEKSLYKLYSPDEYMPLACWAGSADIKQVYIWYHDYKSNRTRYKDFWETRIL